MANISPELLLQINASPSDQYSVIITLKNERLPAALDKKGKFILGHKIFVAILNGEEVKSLINDTEIEAIEADMDIGML